MMVNLVPVVMLTAHSEAPVVVPPPVRVSSHGLLDESSGRTVKLYGPVPTWSSHEISKSFSHMEVDPATVNVKSWEWAMTSVKQSELLPSPAI